MKRYTSPLLALLLVAAHALAQTPTQQQQQSQSTAQQSQTQTSPQAATQQPQTTPTPAAQQPQSRPQPQPTPSPAEESEEDVVRITSNLVQFDAVVTDKKGNPVTDLRPEEFEVYVNGRKQPVTNFSYISVEAGGPAAASPTPPPRPADKTAPPVPPAQLKPGQVRRTVALVVDDLGTSFESMYYVRRALKKFVDEQMQPGDLVAIMRTSAGMGALQQFTSDKNVLYHAIERVRWYPLGRSSVSAFAPMEAAPPGRDNSNGDSSGSNGNGNSDRTSGTDSGAAADADEFRDEIFSVGTLGALNFIVRGMGELPGRKSVIMFSDGFTIFDRDDPAKRQRVLENLRRLVDLANRASVVVYTVDARGLPYLGMTAADDMGGRTPLQIQNLLDRRSQSYFDTQEGLHFLAEQTGGFFVHDRNDLSGAVRRVLDDQKGYYLIGFRPDESLFDRVKGRLHFNTLQLKSKRPGLRVRTRSGFIGVTDAEARPARHTRVEQIVGALASPFASGDVPLRLTSLFGGDINTGSFVTSLMHIDMSNVAFTDEPEGWHKAVLDVVALTFGEQGQVVEYIDRTETVRVRKEVFDTVRRDGIVYTMRVPVKKPGGYQLRVAVRDAQAEKLGSANQFIEVPDLRKNRLALSGLFLTSAADAAAQNAKPAAQPGATEGRANDGSNQLRDAAVRRFRAGAKLDFFYNIYDARTDAGVARPQLQTQVRLFRDGQAVFTGPPLDYDVGAQTDMKRLQAGGRLALGAALAPGEYVLQVVVTDALAKGKYRTATQWIDFEIVK